MRCGSVRKTRKKDKEEGNAAATDSAIKRERYEKIEERGEKLLSLTGWMDACLADWSKYLKLKLFETKGIEERKKIIIIVIIINIIIIYN